MYVTSVSRNPYSISASMKVIQNAFSRPCPLSNHPISAFLSMPIPTYPLRLDLILLRHKLDLTNNEFVRNRLDPNAPSIFRRTLNNRLLWKPDSEPGLHYDIDQPDAEGS